MKEINWKASGQITGLTFDEIWNTSQAVRMERSQACQAGCISTAFEWIWRHLCAHQNALLEPHIFPWREAGLNLELCPDSLCCCAFGQREEVSDRRQRATQLWRFVPQAQHVLLCTCSQMCEWSHSVSEAPRNLYQRSTLRRRTRWFTRSQEIMAGYSH